MHVRITVGAGIDGESLWRRLFALCALLPAVLGMIQPPSEPLPFAQGERLVYNANAGPGLNGRAEMWVEGPLVVRGVRVLVLNSEIKGGFGPIKISDRTTSWIDPDRMAIMRFKKEERNPLGRHSEDIEVAIDGRAWSGVDGRSGTSPSEQPMDELSFIYMLRTMRFPPDSAVVLNRHFDPERNPTILRSLGAGSVKTRAGTFVTQDVEMRVRDARRYRGEGIIRISFSDDACRRPVRIESRVPNAGRIVLELISAEPHLAACAAR